MQDDPANDDTGEKRITVESASRDCNSDWITIPNEVDEMQPSRSTL